MNMNQLQEPKIHVIHQIYIHPQIFSYDIKYVIFKIKNFCYLRKIICKNRLNYNIIIIINYSSTIVTLGN